MKVGSDHDGARGHGLSQVTAGSYEPSVTSSAPSSQSSIFSDSLSASSSIATSISDDFRNTQEDISERDRICARAQLQFREPNAFQSEEHSALASLLKASSHCPTYADVTSVPAPERQNPRRSSQSKHQRPPPLVRQRDRKINFVDNLVDSATQMVEVIWPLSVVPCQSEAGGRGVLPLRTYIEETLRRSRTSYSTLQVALYYLVLIKTHVPKIDFTMEQTLDCPAERSLMCGRRMFLAALVLASKYLQDRNYSAKAWSKMSGLKVCEINTNERMFLNKVNWKLHIAKPLFEKWQEMVLRYTPDPPSSPGWGMFSATSTWKRLIPLLTPELDNLPLIESKLSMEKETTSYFDPATPFRNGAIPTPSLPRSTSQESSPTPLAALPRFLEPSPNLCPPTPALARMGPLPTPVMTPSSVASGTPAVSTCGSRRPSMCSAMALAHKSSFSRCTLDANAVPSSFDTHRPLTRRPSMMSAGSYGSSPESMVSDTSRSSRSSSSSSISTLSTCPSLAPQRACLARQATCRNAGLLPSRLVKEEDEGSESKPIVIDDDAVMVPSPVVADFTVSDKALLAPHRHSRGFKQPQPQANAASAQKSRKRCRAHGTRRSELQEEVRYLLEESFEDSMDLDENAASPSPAADYASTVIPLHCSDAETKQAQSSASFPGWRSTRIPVQKMEGKKRTCCSASVMSTISPVRLLYGEVA